MRRAPRIIFSPICVKEIHWRVAGAEAGNDGARPSRQARRLPYKTSARPDRRTALQRCLGDLVRAALQGLGKAGKLSQQ